MCVLGRKTYADAAQYAPKHVQRGTIIGGVTSDVRTATRLDGLTTDDVQMMLPFMRMVRYDFGELIFASNDVSDGNTYFLVDGGAVVEHNGKCIYSIPQGSSFGEIALWFDTNRSADIRAVGDNTLCLTLPRSCIHQLPLEVVGALKNKSIEDAELYGGTVPMETDRLRQFCALQFRPGLRETFKEWNISYTNSLSTREVRKGLVLCGFSLEEAIFVLLADIFMDGSESITATGFQEAFDVLQRLLDHRSAQSEHNDIPRIDAVDYVKGMQIYNQGNRSKAIERWGMLYCGGAPPVVKVLEAASAEFQLDYKAESFAW